MNKAQMIEAAVIEELLLTANKLNARSNGNEAVTAKAIAESCMAGTEDYDIASKQAMLVARFYVVKYMTELMGQLIGDDKITEATALARNFKNLLTMLDVNSTKYKKLCKLATAARGEFGIAASLAKMTIENYDLIQDASKNPGNIQGVLKTIVWGYSSITH